MGKTKIVELTGEQRARLEKATNTARRIHIECAVGWCCSRARNGRRQHSAKF